MKFHNNPKHNQGQIQQTVQERNHKVTRPNNRHQQRSSRDPNSHSARRTENYTAGTIHKDHESSKKPSEALKQFCETDESFFNSLPKYEQMIFECEKLTKIQHLEREVQCRFFDTTPKMFVNRGIIFMESNPDESQNTETNIPYNPLAVKINFFPDLDSRSVTITDEAPLVGSRNKIVYRAGEKITTCEANFKSHLSFIGDQFDFNLKCFKFNVHVSQSQSVTASNKPDPVLPPYEESWHQGSSAVNSQISPYSSRNVLPTSTPQKTFQFHDHLPVPSNLTVIGNVSVVTLDEDKMIESD
ncbi:unnamed protein product [Allacma fusca]|uniref:Uncharacterized protein n=1 Tax=Allacma fusca TaxID=39272 RepID=A0A8J2KZ04_9HEXA|nr:unnamed protein product [Allacma fusca]